MLSRLRHWVSDRFGFGPIRENILRRRVPKDPPYAGDGQAMLLLFGIQLATGAVLALYYSPSTTSAYQSVVHITDAVTLGWFIRGLHYWAGGTWMVLLVYHLFRQILVGGYKPPREGTWLIGVLLLVLVVVTGFIGYTLRWDERAVYAIRVALFHFGRVPWIGDDLVALIQGGAEISTLTLTRLYAVHVVIAPLLLGALIAYHVYLIVVRGTTAPTETEVPVETAEEQKQVYKADARSEHRGEEFFPETPARLGGMAVLTFAIVITLTLVLGARELYPRANLITDAFPMEEWWWAWYSALAALLPPWLAPYFYVGFPVLLLAILILLPFVDRGPNRGVRHRPIAAGVVVLCVIGLLYLSSLRRQSPWTAWPQQAPPELPPGVELPERLERGRVLFTTYGCHSCHAVAGDGPAVGPDIARLSDRYSKDALRRYILSPPPEVAMPGYYGRIPPEDLELVVDFCLVAQTFPRGK